MPRRVAKTFAALTAATAALLTSAAHAVENLGVPTSGSIGFQPAYSEQARRIHEFHDYLLVPIIVAIVLFVAGLLAYVIFNFSEKKNPVPSKLAHHTLLEVAWTVVPVLILVVIAIPSFRLLTYQLTEPKADLTVKVTGLQWYWQYDYPDGAQVVSNPKPPEEIKPEKGDIRNLTVDNEAVVPVNKLVRLIVTADAATGVNHGFIIQSLGVRIDAVPGRLNSTYFKAEREGMFYGQCSKICGHNHSYMPIAFRVVSQQEYDKWLIKTKQGSLVAPHGTVANRSSL